MHAGKILQTHSDFLTKIAEKDTKHRNSHSEVFCKVDILKNFCKTRRETSVSESFYKVQTEALQLS